MKNVLVLVKTEFGKIIGGFNPIGWSSQLHDKYSTDDSNQCFSVVSGSKTKNEFVTANICYNQ